jgi:hypothetical protein
MNRLSFGDALLERGLISPRQFQEATQAVVLFGDRLGTHLVASGALDVETLEEALAAHLGVPRPPVDELESPKPEALAAIPRELVERFCLFAFRREGETLHVAMTDPWDCEAGELLLRQTGLRVLPYVVSEARMRRLLQRHFDEAAAERRALGIDTLAPEEELMDVESFASLYDSTPSLEPVAAPPAPEPGTAPTAEAHSASEDVDALLRVSDPSEAVRCGLAVALRYARIAAFLVVRDRIAGLQAVGQVVRRDLTRVFAGESLKSPLLRAAATGRVTRGALCRDGDRALIDALGSPAGDAVVLPVRVRKRVVNLLYAEDLIGRTPEVACPALSALAEGMGRAYEGLILDRKLAGRQRESSR